MKDGERERPIENYGKKEQKEWLDNTLPDPHPCTAGNKDEEHTNVSCVFSERMGRAKQLTRRKPTGITALAKRDCQSERSPYADMRANQLSIVLWKRQFSECQ